MFPNSTQKCLLKQFIGVYRYFYNRTISYCKNIENDSSFYYVNNSDKKTKIIVECPKSKYNWKSLKKILYDNFPSWLKKIRFDAHSCKQAIKEALTGFKTNLSKSKQTGKKFESKIKTKKDLRQTIIFEKSSLSKKFNTLFANYKDKEGNFIFRNLRMSDVICNYDYCGSSLTYNLKLNEFILNLTYNDKQKECNNDKICAIDQGVNNFMTVYSDHKISLLGINCTKKMYKICKEIDIIKSRIDRKEFYSLDESGKKQIHMVNANRKRNLKKSII